MLSGEIDPVREDVNVTLLYRSTGQEAWNTLATVTTNETSGYSYVWSSSSTGTYEVKASWPGDINALAAESSVQTVTVQEETESGLTDFQILYLVAAGVAASAAATYTAVYFTKIRKLRAGADKPGSAGAKSGAEEIGTPMAISEGGLSSFRHQRLRLRRCEGQGLI